jgi:hypothetical protein
MVKGKRKGVDISVGDISFGVGEMLEDNVWKIINEKLWIVRYT